MWSRTYKKFIIYLDLIIYLVCLSGIYQIIYKSDIPFTIKKTDSNLIIESSPQYPSIESKILRSIDGIKFSSREELEVYIDNKQIGEPLLLNLMSAGGELQYTVNTVNFYSEFYIIAVIITGTLFFLIAIFVFLKSTEKKPPHLLHWVVVSTAIIMMTTWGNLNVLPNPSGLLLRGIFHLAYLLAPVLFLHFNLSFPQDRSFRQRYFLYFLYFSAVIVSTMQTAIFIHMHGDGWREHTLLYITWFNLGRILFVVCVLGSLAAFVYSFITIRSSAERKKLKWLLLGYLIGPASFVLLWVIPLAVTAEGLIPEEIMILLMTSIPVTFAIAILKYHLLDIDLILNRSFVYAIVIGSLLLIYSLVLAVSASFAGGYAKDYPIFAAIIIGLLFQPLKNRVQYFVDMKFFRVRYNYRQVLKKLLQEISNSNNLLSLSEKIIKEINILIPTERSAFFIYQSDSKSLSILSHYNMDKLQNKKYLLKSADIFQFPTAYKDSIEPGVLINYSEEKIFNVFGLSLILPVQSTTKEIFGFIVLGKKKAGNRFRVEDIDLLTQVASEAGSTIERIYLNEKYIAEHYQKVKLEELNQLKTFFVSSVSHELKTPITSIKMFSEIINNNENLEREKKEEYFRIINGECNRLTRMIDNVLNIVRIERGIKSYRFELTDLDEIVDESLRIMEYQLSVNKFRTNIIKSPEEKFIYADKDAIIELLVNLISNSIKYSHEVKEINICTGNENSTVTITVQDKGIGIPAGDLESIFNPYFRSNDAEAKRIAGTGLGLAIVKHVADAHNALIKVESILHEGTSFKIYFHKTFEITEGKNETNSDY